MSKTLPIRFLGALCVIVLVGSQMFTITGCANQIPPTGGPRDSLPPILLTARPLDSSRNFIGKKIVLEFNEFVQLDNPFENLLVSPTPKLNPLVESKLRTVTVTIKDTLEANTTYTIDFGRTIKDINEGNVLNNFRYIFSTGNRIDQNELKGKVILAETGKPDSTLMATLYRKGEDSTVFYEKPRYISRLDSGGNFHFKNLPAGTFYLYAFKDEGKSNRYTSRQQLFAFADQPVYVGDSSSSIILYAFNEKEAPKPTAPPRTPGRSTSNANADKRLRLETNLEGGEQDLLKPFEVYFRTAPLKEFDSTKIVFTDEKFNPLPNYKIIRDTNNAKLSIQYPWQENTGYAILVDKDFASDTLGRKLTKNDTLVFRTKREGAYGAVRLRFMNLDLSMNPVLQIVQNDAVVYSHVFTSREFYRKLFVPGEYEMRILFDDNKNGKWDPGNFFEGRKQPEKVMAVTRKLNVKANWDSEIDINL